MSQTTAFDQLKVERSNLIDPSQAAEILGVSVHTLERWRCSGRYALRYRKVGRRILYHADDLRAFLNREPMKESNRPAPRHRPRGARRAAAR
ncbi:MAG TPA: helix-turn-helix domain-containing protein [Terriglobales bacterium]|nr:helix-turn-helix domain-containing protein [Terriglobales bacterium]